MTLTDKTNSEQATLWNGVGGCSWADEQPLLDQLLAPFEELLVREVAALSPRRVLDVGCGAGATTLAVAHLLAEGGHATGIDISTPLVELARRRAERDGVPATFLHGDAQEHAFDDASFDMVISRFGIMFFAEPVRAFANLRRAAADGAALRCLAWRSAAENPFMTAAERAAAPLVPDLAPRQPQGPGQFAFADAGHVARILAASGWGAIDIQPLDVPCTMPERDLLRYVTRLGPLGRALPAMAESTRGQVMATVRAAFEPYVDGEVVRVMAACWLIAARA
jgi:SAM-dependent methyltransferase